MTENWKEIFSLFVIDCNKQLPHPLDDKRFLNFAYKTFECDTNRIEVEEFIDNELRKNRFPENIIERYLTMYYTLYLERGLL